MKVRVTLFLLGLLLFNRAAGQSLFFEHLGVRDGLSQFTVHDFYQDEFGQMWIATSDGLNRYDGSKTEAFKPVVGDTTGLFGNNIQRVIGNGKGKLYLQCQSGLLEYDLRTQKFQTLMRYGINNIAYANGKVWIASGSTLKYYDEATGTVKNYKSFPASVQIRTLLETTDGTLHVGTNTGLLALDRNGREFKLMDEVFVVCLCEDRNKSVWMGTLEDGLFRINSRNEIVSYRHDPRNPASVSDNFIRAICQDDLGGYWIGTFKGLDYFNPETKTFRNFRHSIVESNSLSDLSVWCIRKDSQGSLWIGTFFGGVNIFNPEFSFNRFYRPTGTNAGPNSAIIGKVAEDSKGNLWICSDYGGLNYYDVSKNTFRYFRSEPGNPSTPSSNTLKDLLLDEARQTLWIGSHLGGLDKLDLRTHRIQRVALNSGNRNIDKYVRTISRYGNLLLLGTHDGIQLYNPETGELKPLLEPGHELGKGQVWDMMIDSQEVLWFSVRSAIGRYDLKSRKLLPVPGNLVLNSAVFFEDHENQVWIGSAGKGLFRWDRKSSTPEHFHTGNSDLADNYILDIAESATGYILISTNSGLSRFESSKRAFYNYRNHQFFPFEALNEKSLYVNKNGEIILSSLSGMMIISEKDLLYHPKPYQILLTSLSVNNKPVRPGDSEDILKSSITTTDTLVLSESHSVISFDFAITNYIKALKSEIQYKLEGFDDNWIEAQAFNNITYTNLGPGTYHLKIRSIYSATGAEMAAAGLTLIVKPRFYKAWYAWLFYALVLAGVLYLFYSQVRLKDSLRNADIQSRHAEEVNQSKLRFFMNVSHEIRTPVTLIMAQLDMLLNSAGSIPPTVQGKLQNVRRNAANLKKLINELLDFKKQEEGLVRLKVTRQDIVKYLHHIFVSFQDYGNSLNINTSFLSTEEKIEAWFDIAQMDKVFYNLLSNAFKFTPSSGSISLIIKRSVDAVEITVEDTGVGIREESITRIFNRFYQVRDTDSSIQPLDPGTGIGLALVKDIVEQHHGTISVLSNFGKGTAFKITLPLGKAHFNPEDFPENALQEIRTESDTEVAGHEEKKNTILIVEDNAELKNVLVELFLPMYNVVTVSDGAEVMQKVKTVMPDLVLLDIMLPNVSGMEICKKIKSDLATRNIPVVLLTAAAAPEKKLEGLQIGADDYITKPFESRELIIRCNSLINNRILLKDVLAPVSDKVYSSNKQHQQIIHDATQVVLKHLDNPEFSIDQFAAELNISRSSLFTKIKEITGQTPNDFVTEIRLRRSLVLLKEDKDEAVGNIAFSVGFNDPSYFIKQFKKFYGVTPGQYRVRG